MMKFLDEKRLRQVKVFTYEVYDFPDAVWRRLVGDDDPDNKKCISDSDSLLMKWLATKSNYIPAIGLWLYGGSIKAIAKNRLKERKKVRAILARLTRTGAIKVYTDLARMRKVVARLKKGNDNIPEFYTDIAELKDAGFLPEEQGEAEMYIKVKFFDPEQYRKPLNEILKELGIIKSKKKHRGGGSNRPTGVGRDAP